MLPHMRRQILRRIIQMHKRPLHSRHTLKHILQTLPQIMRIPQTRPLIQHNVHLQVQLVARMVRLEALDVLDGLRKSHGQVQQHVTLVSGGGCAGEVADVGGCCAGPGGDYVEGEEDAAEGV
jgi:hypothetical protein